MLLSSAYSCWQWFQTVAAVLCYVKLICKAHYHPGAYPGTVICFLTVMSLVLCTLAVSLWHGPVCGGALISDLWGSNIKWASREITQWLGGKHILSKNIYMLVAKRRCSKTIMW